MIRYFVWLFHHLTEIRVNPYLPLMKRSLTTDFESENLDRDIEAILTAGIVSNPIDAKQLLDEYKAENAYELFAKLPPRPLRNIKMRLRYWWCSVEGSYPFDPHAREFYERMQ